MARQVKSEAERATAALGVAERKVAKLQREHDRLKAELESTATALAEAKRIRDYRAQHPALSASREDDTGEHGGSVEDLGDTP
jgi:chromosome segregation ATPase